MRKSAKERKIVKQQKEVKTTTNTFINSDNEVANFIKIAIIVLILLVGFTLVTDYILNREDKKAATEIQYTKIIVGNILSRSETEYYVLAEAKDDTNITVYDSYLSTYKNKEEHFKVYKVDLSDGFNESYVSDKANLNVTDITEIKFSGSALLHIKEGKIIEVFDNSDKIVNKLAELSA